MTRILHVGVDIDDVLHPWGAGAHALCEAAGITQGRLYSGWRMWEDYGCTKDEWLAVINRAVLEGGLYDIPPIPGSVEALRRLHFAGHQIHLVTARGFFENGELIKQHTYEWVEEFAVPHRTLTFAKDKPAAVAELRIGGFPISHFVDDGVHNFEALETVQDLDVRLLTAPHNGSFYTPFRIETMDEFADLVLEAAESEEQ